MGRFRLRLRLRWRRDGVVIGVDGQVNTVLLRMNYRALQPVTLRSIYINKSIHRDRDREEEYLWCRTLDVFLIILIFFGITPIEILALSTRRPDRCLCPAQTRYIRIRRRRPIIRWPSL